MEIKSLQDIADLEDVEFVFAIRKSEGKSKVKYVSDLEIRKDRKSYRLNNVMLKDVLFARGEKVLEAKAMDAINKYAFECNKYVMGNAGFRFNEEEPGYLVYNVPGPNSKLEKSFDIWMGGSSYIYKSLDGLHADAKSHITSRRYSRLLDRISNNNSL